MPAVQLYLYSNCSSCKKAQAALAESGLDIETRDIFKQIAPRITARSETFRILSEGRVTSTGARERIEVIVRLSGKYIDTIAYRENL